MDRADRAEDAVRLVHPGLAHRGLTALRPGLPLLSQLLHVRPRGLRDSRSSQGNGVNWMAHTAMQPAHARRGRRSEEHTSELQSRFDLVCRLLLEKKKKTKLKRRRGEERATKTTHDSRRIARCRYSGRQG